MGAISGANPMALIAELQNGAELVNYYDKTISDGRFQAIAGSEVITLTGDNIDLSQGNYFTRTLSADWTVTMTNAPQNKAYIFVLELINAGDYILSLPANTKFIEGAAPKLSTGGIKDKLIFSTTDGGATFELSYLIGYAVAI